ncbi:sigma-70 family RNA polymerase sigma factor [Trinickia sp. YCB016]
MNLTHDSPGATEDIAASTDSVVAVDARAQAPGVHAKGSALPDDDAADSACIVDVLNGRRDRFTELVIRHQPRVRRFLLRHAQQPDDVADLTQETFVQAYLKLPSWRAEAKFSTWLIGIALNLARNHANRNPHLRHVHGTLDEDDEATGPSNSHDPERTFAESSRHHALLAALGQLPTELRLPLTLIALDDIPYDQAAVVLAIPIGTLKSRLNRARRLLRKTLEHHGLVD